MDSKSIMSKFKELDRKIDTKFDQILIKLSNIGQVIASPEQSKPETVDWEKNIKSKSKSTQKKYIPKIRDFNNYLKQKKLKVVNEGIIWDYLDKIKEEFKGKQGKELSNSALNVYLKAFIFRYNETEKLGLHLKKLKEFTINEKSAIPPQTLSTIMRESKVDPRMHLMISILYDTGARMEELSSLKHRNIVRLEDGSATVQIYPIKGSKTRKVKISDMTSGLYIDYFKDSINNVEDELFDDSSNTMEHQWRTFCHKKEIPFYSPHWFRHTKCSNMLNIEKMELSFVMSYMGHANVRTTSIYLHSDVSALTEQYLSKNQSEVNPQLPAAMPIQTPVKRMKVESSRTPNDGKPKTP